MNVKRITSLEELKQPGTYDIPLTLSGPAFIVVQNLKLAGHAINHDQTSGPGVTGKVEQIRVFHYRTCAACNKEN